MQLSSEKQNALLNEQNNQIIMLKAQIEQLQSDQLNNASGEHALFQVQEIKEIVAENSESFRKLRMEHQFLQDIFLVIKSSV